MASCAVEPMDVAAKAPAGPSGGSDEPDRKDFTASAAKEVEGGTVDVGTVLREHHAVPVSTKGAAVLQAMDTREMGAGVEASTGEREVLGGKAAPSPASLAAKVQSAAATTGVYVTQSADEVRAADVFAWM